MGKREVFIDFSGLRAFSFPVVLAVHLGIISLNANAAASKTDGPVYLVKLMQLDRAPVLGGQMQLALSASAAQRNALAKCVEAADTSAIADIVAAQIKRTMTEDEIEDAIRFYRSPTGKKYTLRDRGILGATIARKEPPAFRFTAVELAEIEKFTNSPAGVKLLVKGVATSDELLAALSPLATQIVDQCHLELINSRLQ